ncbi:MAG: HEAT repeat domain-containing protein [Bacteroidota bacterium]
MKPITDQDLVDHLSGALSEERSAALKAALANSPELREELAELEGFFNAIKQAPEAQPSAMADTRFTTLLQEELAAATTRPQAKIVGLRLYHYAAAAAAVALIFTTGWYFGGAGDRVLTSQLAEVRQEMEVLMQNDRPSARIRATNVALELSVADPTTIGNLGFLLRNDPSPNVRLAALEALQGFPDNMEVREQLLAAMRETPPEVVRFELIEALVRLKEKRLLPYLEELMNTDTVPQPVRDAAEMASFKLI